MHNMNRKIALVTGGSRGLGKDMALSLAKKGLDVILTYHTQKGEAEQVVAEIEANGGRAAALQLDASKIDSFDGFYANVKEVLQSKWGSSGFDCLINNAGTALYAPVASATEAQMDGMIDIHFKAVFFLTQKALPLLQDGGRIVNISSGLARFSFPGYSIYAAMKGAVEVLTRYMAVELGPRRITVNVVAPGAIATDFGGGAVRDNAQLSAHIASTTALGRVGVATDIGGVVAFLCSDDAGWVNGQRIEVSGGVNL